MSNLCIQIQPNRAPELDVAALRNLCDALAGNEHLVEGCSFVEGEDGGPYLNFMFETNNLQALWALLQDQLYRDKTIGALLKRASIATCEGEHEWEDYLLLHHFDRTLRLDDFTGG